jgi:hypothetical protein
MNADELADLLQCLGGFCRGISHTAIMSLREIAVKETVEVFAPSPRYVTVRLQGHGKLLDWKFVDKQQQAPRGGVSIGDAILLAIGERSQKGVAEEIGEPPSTFNKWIKGTYLPDFPDLAKIEAACGRPAGFILHAAGYVAEVRTVEEAIAMDPALDDDHRSGLLAGYRSAVRKVRAVRRTADDG